MKIEQDKHGKDKFMFICPMCKRGYQFGPQIYDGRKLTGYEMHVCKSCYDANWDGWTSQHNKLLEEQCAEQGVSPPPPNDKGWFPREF